MNIERIEIEHPGIILKEEFMIPYDISAYRLAKETGISTFHLTEKIRGALGRSLDSTGKNKYKGAAFHIVSLPKEDPR